MHCGFRLLFIAAFAAILGSGCHHAHHPPHPAPEPVVLPTVSRSSWKVDAMVPERKGELVHIDSTYQSLTERQAQCLASAHSSKANLLDEEAEALGASARPLVDLVTREHRNRPLKQQILRAFALEERNQSAGQSLETFHRLVEAEAKADVLRAALQELDSAVREVQKRRELGLPVSAELKAVEAQRLKVQQDTVRLENAIDQGNENLAMLIGADAEPQRRFLPQTDWRPDMQIPDVKAAIDDALRTRPGHRLSERLAQETDRRTLSAVKLFLQTVSAVSGSSTTPPPTLIGIVTRFAIVGGGGREEAESRQDQMRRINSETERVIASEVMQAVAKMEAQRDVIEFARRKLVREQDHLRDLEAKQGQGLAAPIQLLTARQQVRQAEVELVEEIAGWHIAKVRLRKAQGHLVGECTDGSRGSCGPHGCVNCVHQPRVTADLAAPATVMPAILETPIEETPTPATLPSAPKPSLTLVPSEE